MSVNYFYSFQCAKLILHPHLLIIEAYTVWMSSSDWSYVFFTSLTSTVESEDKIIAALSTSTLPDANCSSSWQHFWFWTSARRYHTQDASTIASQFHDDCIRQSSILSASPAALQSKLLMIWHVTISSPPQARHQQMTREWRRCSANSSAWNCFDLKALHCSTFWTGGIGDKSNKMEPSWSANRCSRWQSSCCTDSTCWPR